jgi:ATP-dependent RNA helicase DDX41
VLRIGRTGRCGKDGVATTYINKNQDETILSDLKHLLIEANQAIPNFLQAIPEDKSECAFCGGLGHQPNNCHKLENQRIKSLSNKNALKKN